MTELRAGHNCWRIVRADRAAIVIDAEDFYRAAREAMLSAKHQIILVGWDFDARIDLTLGDEHPEAPRTVGALMTWLVKHRPGLNVYVLRWDKGAIKTLFRGATLLTLTRWRFLMDRIHLKLDGAHPTGAGFDYGIDLSHLKTYAASAEPGAWDDYRAKFVEVGPDAYLAAVGGAERVASLAQPVY